MELETAISKRHSCRKFDDRAVSPDKVNQLLWAGQGKNDFGKRNAPSAGGCYPIELLILEDVKICGVKAPLMIAITALFEKTKRRYGKRAFRYVYLEAGHVAQNICLQGISLGLDSVCIGAFSGRHIKRLLNLKELIPVYVVLIG